MSQNELFLHIVACSWFVCSVVAASSSSSKVFAILSTALLLVSSPRLLNKNPWRTKTGCEKVSFLSSHSFYTPADKRRDIVSRPPPPLLTNYARAEDRRRDGTQTNSIYAYTCDRIAIANSRICRWRRRSPYIKDLLLQIVRVVLRMIDFGFRCGATL